MSSSDCGDPALMCAHTAMAGDVMQSKYDRDYHASSCTFYSKAGPDGMSRSTSLLRSHPSRSDLSVISMIFL